METTHFVIRKLINRNYSSNTNHGKNGSKPTPTTECAKHNPMNMVVHKLIKSTQFFVKPIFFWIFVAIACTIPSPGLGIKFMFSIVAAPIPVKYNSLKTVQIIRSKMLYSLKSGIYT